MKTGELHIREDESGNTDVILNPVGNTVWLTQSEIARLLDTYTVTVADNLRGVFKSGVLREEKVTKTYRYKTDSVRKGLLSFIIWMLLSHWLTASGQGIPMLSGHGYPK